MTKRFLMFLTFASLGLAAHADSGKLGYRPSIRVAGKTVNSLKFSVDSIYFLAYPGEMISAQTVTLSASSGAPSVIFTTGVASWLTVPPAALGPITFSYLNVSTNLLPGHYSQRIIVSAIGYVSDTLTIKLVIADGISTNPIEINFQDHASIPPTGWLRDFGQSFSLRTGAFQSTQKQYGWKRRSDGSPIEITGNGFNRMIPEDVSLATLFYMQANNLSGTFPGTKIQSYWEMKLPNGTYDVTVGVGDGKIDNASQHNYINVEGIPAITNFSPVGPAGASTRFKQATIRVQLKDELLTINADGGTNTRINFVKILPVTIAPFLGWSDNNINITIQKGSTATKNFSVTALNSSNQLIGYNLSASYGSGGSGWLSFSPIVTSVSPIINFNYTKAASLPLGIYTAVVRATKSGFTSSVINIQLRVIDNAIPYVISSSPANNETHVNANIVSIAANNLNVPAVAGFKGGVDNSTVNTNTVKLYKIVNGIAGNVSGVVQGTGGGDAISFSPSVPLVPGSTYRFSISNGVKSYSGAAFIPFSSMFVTDETPPAPVNFLSASFTKIPIAATVGKQYTSLAFGPDDRFYALRLDGVIERYDVNHADGTLSNQQIISTLTTKYGVRSAIGLVFAPTSTATSLKCYVTHSSSGLVNAPAFDGNLSQLTGPDLGSETLLITKLPRSSRDHMTNGISFGPDGRLYISQGSNSSAGAFDNDWQRTESLLSGSILRLDLTKLRGLTLPLNVQTTTNQAVINAAPSNSIFMSDGTYNPYSSISPITIYASGIRNTYSLVWHSNGQLYVPTNGSGGGGNSPASVNGTRRPDGKFYSGPDIPATTGVQVQNDWLFRVNPTKRVGYFGHPNPFRGQYVENRGAIDNILYPPTVSPDSSYRGFAYNFGFNHSPDGVIEYKSNTFNGALKNKLLVCRFSGGGDIVVMEPWSMEKVPITGSIDTIYDIKRVTTGAGNNGLIGMSGFTNPLNLVEDLVNGNLYVIEYNWNSSPGASAQITLLKVNMSSNVTPANLSLLADKGVISTGLINYTSYNVTIINRGDYDLKIKSIDVTGPGADLYEIRGIPAPSKASPLIMKKNTSLLFTAAVPTAFDIKKPVKIRVTSIEDSVKEVLLNKPEDENKLAFEIDSLRNSDSLKTHLPRMRVYPNPNKGNNLNIELSNFEKREFIDVSIYNLEGRKLETVRVKTDNKGFHSFAMNLAEPPKSHILIVKADSPSIHREEKLIIE